MGIFDETVRERRSLVASSRRRIGGNRSRRCSLPSDGLSQVQRGRLNGPVRTYALSRPMSWEQFQAMPADLQKRYLSRLRERFGLGPRGVGERVFQLSGPQLDACAGSQHGREEPDMDEGQQEALRQWLEEAP